MKYLDLTSFIDSEIFLLLMDVGDCYDDIYVTKKSKKRIYLSNGSIIHIKSYISKDNIKYHYLDGKNIKQILRNIEGFLIHRMLSI